MKVSFKVVVTPIIDGHPSPTWEQMVECPAIDDAEREAWELALIRERRSKDEQFARAQAYANKWAEHELIIAKLRARRWWRRG